MVLPGVIGSQGLVVLRPGQSAVPIAFTVDRDSLKLATGDGQGELRFTGNDGFGLQVTQVMRFSVDNYVVDREIRVSNAHSVPQGVELAVAWTAPVEWPKDHESICRAAARSTRCGWRRDRPGPAENTWGAGAPTAATADGSVSKAPWGRRVRAEFT